MNVSQRNEVRRYCNHCGSDLIFVRETIEDRDLPSPVTTLIYHCSNKPCQENINKKTRLQAQHYKQQEKAKKERYKNRTKYKQL